MCRHPFLACALFGKQHGFGQQFAHRIYPGWKRAKVTEKLSPFGCQASACLSEGHGKPIVAPEHVKAWIPKSACPIQWIRVYISSLWFQTFDN
jgi:hypothetical protein